MARNVIITNGSGTANITNGNYNVAANVGGYDNTSITPASVNIVEGTNDYSFTISATGTLTLHVTEDGTSSDIPIVGATFKRTDSAGNQYGDVITTNENGDAVLSNVPYAVTDAPTIYYVQLTSDGAHEFSDTVASTTLTTQTSTIQITNTLSALRTFDLCDANYANLPIVSGTLTLE